MSETMLSEATRPLAAAPPLDGLTLPAAVGLARVSIADTSGRLVLRAEPSTAASIGRALGMSLDGPINRATRNETCSVARLGPDEWLFLADAERDPWLSARISQAAAGAPISLVDVSDRGMSLLLEGSRAENVLSVGCPLPLGLRAFPIDRATRTLFGRSEIVLWRHGASLFHLEVARSFVPYVVALIASAIADEAAIEGIGAAS